MPKCPNCQSKLEELTEITGYHYWMCGNSDCKMSYKFYRNAAQQSAQDGEVCPVCGGAKYVLANDGNAIKCMPCNGTGKRQ